MSLALPLYVMVFHGVGLVFKSFDFNRIKEMSLDDLPLYNRIKWLRDRIMQPSRGFLLAAEITKMRIGRSDDC